MLPASLCCKIPLFQFMNKISMTKWQYFFHKLSGKVNFAEKLIM